jgi:hypothetical protein
MFSLAIPAKKSSKEHKSFGLFVSSPVEIIHLSSSHINITHPSPLNGTTLTDSPSKALEREFCKEFECCSSNFAGLHDLLAHYETNHPQSSAMQPLLSIGRVGEEMLYTRAFRASGHGETDSYAHMADICIKGKRAVVDMEDPEMDMMSDDDTVTLESTNNALAGLKRRPTRLGVEKKKKRKGNDSAGVSASYLLETSEGTDTDIDILTIDDEDLLMMKVDGMSLVLPPTPPISETCGSPGTTSFILTPLVPEPRFALMTPPPSAPSPLFKRKAVFMPGADPLAPPPTPKIKKVRQSSLSVLDPETGQRKYVCAVVDCGKQYKNANGLKYHLLHAHPDGVGVPAEYHDLFQKKKEDEGHRPYTCSIMGCEKKYKNLNGLKVCSIACLICSIIWSISMLLFCRAQKRRLRKRRLADGDGLQRCNLLQILNTSMSSRCSRRSRL